jgi:hypothetical protein
MSDQECIRRTQPVGNGPHRWPGARGRSTVNAGPFRMTDTDGVDDFVLWCFDIAQSGW